MRTPLLTSTLIRLRALEPEDIRLMYSLENNTSMWDTASTTQPYSRGAIKNFIASTQSDIYKEGQLRLVIDIPTKTEETTDDSSQTITKQFYKAIGFIDLTDFSPRNLRAEVGIALLPKYQHQGFGSEALRLVEQYATEVLFIHQLYAYVSMENTPAIGLFSKAGFEQTGTLKDWLKSKDSYKTVALMQKGL